MDTHNAGKRIKLGMFDGTIIIPFFLMVVFFHIVTTIFFAAYVAFSIYNSFKGRAMIWLVRRARFWLRGGIIFGRTASYWRYLRK